MTTYKVSVWPKGYADREGAKYFRVTDKDRARDEAYDRYGSSALVFAVTADVPPPVCDMTEAQCRAMSQNDNS